MLVQYHFDSYRKSFKARNQLNFKSDCNYIHLKKVRKFHNERQIRTKFECFASIENSYQRNRLTSYSKVQYIYKLSFG